MPYLSPCFRGDTPEPRRGQHSEAMMKGHFFAQKVEIGMLNNSIDTCRAVRFINFDTSPLPFVPSVRALTVAALSNTRNHFRSILNASIRRCPDNS